MNYCNIKPWSECALAKWGGEQPTGNGVWFLVFFRAIVSKMAETELDYMIQQLVETKVH